MAQQLKPNRSDNRGGFKPKTKIMATIITIIAIGILYILSDTITEVLSNGKSFAPNELKPFR